MSVFEYRASKQIAQYAADREYGFSSLLMAAMREADSVNLSLLQRAFPEVWHELLERYNAPGGVLPGEDPPPV